MPIVFNNIPGAKWWRFDFHTHTPKSHDYGKGDANEKLISPQDWLLNHMAVGLQCVAVTDHNSGEWIDELKAALQDLEQSGHPNFRPLTLFPAVEISTNGGVHILAILDPSENSARIAALLGAVGFTGSYGDTDACTNKSIVEVLQIIDSYKGVGIPAHVDGPSGLFKEITSGVTLNQISSEAPLLAVEVLDKHFTLPASCASWNPCPTFVLGSDSHKASETGRRFCWVKMQNPNIDSLRLALHDGSDGVILDQTIDPNALNRLILHQLTVRDGQLAGRGGPLDVRFSPWLTTLIGGRGSGKSAIIQYLRLLLGQVDGMPPSIQTEFSGFNQVPADRRSPGMLTATTRLKLEFSHGARYFSLEWSSGNRELHEFNFTTSEWQIAPIGDLRSRFPMRIFNQKELFELTKNPQFMIGLLDDAIDPAGLDQVKAQIESASSNFFKSRRQERELRQIAAGLQPAEARLSDIEAKLKELESEENQALFASIAHINELDSKLTEGKLWLTVLVDTLKPIAEDCPAPELSDDLLNPLDGESSAALKQKFQEMSALAVEIGNLSEKVSGHISQWDVFVSSLPWQMVKSEKLSQLQAVSQRLSDLGIAVDAKYNELLQQRTDYLGVVNKAKMAREQADAQVAISNQHLQDYVNARQLLSDLRSQVATAWSHASEGRLRIQIDVMGNLEQGEASLREIIRRQDSAFAKDLFVAPYDDIPASGLLSCLLSGSDMWARRNEVVNGLYLGAFGNNPSKIDARLCEHLRRLNASSPEDIDRLLLWVPDDSISLFLTQDGREKAIAAGSGGQRTASILAVLLKTSRGPLIIDQPEDDLDARFIMDLIVDGLRELKLSQQVIVVTHNPNIPVNGGAEQIIEMAFVAGQIRVEQSGALQDTSVRQSVCDVMEGGKEALMKRYFRVAKAL